MKTINRQSGVAGLATAMKGLAKLRYDGVMRCGLERLAQFTELDEASPSHGASFYLPMNGLTSAAVSRRRLEKRNEFGGFKLA